MIQIAATEQEKQLVYESVNKLKEKLRECSALAKELLQALDENYLAIDNKYKKEISKETETIMCVMWQLNIRLFKMSDQKSRIVSPEIFEF